MAYLVVQPAQHAARRARMVVLHEVDVEASFAKRAPVPALEEESTLVAEHARLDDEHVGDRGGDDAHRRQDRYRSDGSRSRPSR
jgi:hypothetical protein